MLGKAIAITSTVVLLTALLITYEMNHWPISEEQYNEHISGKVFLLSGASSGIGEEVAYQLAALGAKVIITARSVDKLEKVRENAVKHHGGKVGDIRVMRCDMSDTEQAVNLIPDAISIFGRVDHVILNQAALATGPFLATKAMQDPQFIERVFRTNVFSNIQAAIAVIPELEKTGGHMLVTSSISGEIPFFWAGLYSSSKYALNGFFYSLQQELEALKSNVTVSVAALGMINTEMTKAVTDHLMNIPDFTKGDLAECAQLMIDNFIVRSPTLSYPKISLALSRVLLWLKPIIGDPLLADPNAHKDAVRLSERVNVYSKSEGMQAGNLG